MTAMKLSVAICTWNRAKLLDETLTAMRQLDVPSGVTWELLVVNNNSTDDTDAVLTRHAAALPLVRLFEPRPGKSHAANTAAAHATGDLLVWTDDDVRVQSGWLAAYARAATDWPEAAFFAGPIDPWFEREPPAWIRRHLSELSGVYVIVDYGTAARPLTRADPVFGANMAFRSAVARTFPLNAQLGRIQGALFGADDTELIARVAAAGHYGVTVPDARLQHFNPSSRLTKAYVARWYRDSGRTLVRQGALGASRRVAGVPPWVVRRWLQEQAKRGLWAARGDRRWFDAFRQSARLGGMIQEVRASAEGPRRVGDL
jgi:glycosyltransferase involved in cell wall biosynthesis